MPRLTRTRCRLPWLISLLLAATATGADPEFRRHELNAEATFSARAAIDVNRDGKLDVVSGGWWYEAPTWKQHFVREVQVIRGRYDDYAHLPLDVNGDGWMDLVSANYRSRSIYWVEHPGASLGDWKKHLVDTPGPMETARLVDVDGDGSLDVLPNGVQFAAWWELTRPTEGNTKLPPRWVRHDLPSEVAGHGVGFGDVNGDGRGDVVGPRGWLEAPVDRRRQRWLWHGDFHLDRDSSVPILVTDVDGDRDQDLVWGRAHSIGLYWLEQVRGEDDSRQGGGRQWVRHAIDTSWSQPHSLLLADMDNDGQQDVVAGKRYMGHDGRDLGEYDSLVVYWYAFDAKTRTWHRHTISEGGPVGLGLDPTAVDLDGDGDTDLVGAGRSGLYWLENLLIGKRAAGEASASEGDIQYDDHQTLLVYRDRADQSQPVRGPADWARRRAHILAGMQQAMGPFPECALRTPLEIETLDEVRTDDYVRRKITFTAESGDRVPAYLLIPQPLSESAPAMLCLHQTTRIGKGEPAGFGGRASLHYADELAQRGYVCIVPDYPSFGDYAFDFRKDGAHYASGSMKAIWNNVRAVDVLQSLPQVNRDSIGCIGHSLGGHNALFTAAFDQRLRAVVTSCGFTAFHHYYQGKLAGWTSDRYMPRIRDVYQNDPDLVPFDFYEVLASLAPRALFVNAPLEDSNFEVNGVKKVVRSAAEVYKLLEAEDKLRAVYPDSGHDFPDAVRKEAYDWLDQQLKRPT